jgi:hypothetical protein
MASAFTNASQTNPAVVKVAQRSTRQKYRNV